MHALLHPVGSHGDVHPLVAIGRGLVARGHRVTLVTAAPFRGVAAACGFAFATVGTDADYEAVVHNPDLWHPRRGLRTIFAPESFARHLRESYRHLAERYVPGETVCVAGDLGFPAARLAQETLGLPVVSSHIAPVAFQSVADPPTVAFGRPPDWLPRWACRWAYRLGGKYAIDPAFRPAVNGFRRELGLPPLARLWGTWNDSPQRVLGLFPEWFAHAPDWPAHLRQAGFPVYDGGGELPPAVEQFLSDGPPPVVISFGTAMRTGRAHFAAAVETVRQVGRRGLVLAKSGEQVPPLPPGFLHAEYAPFGRVFPRCAAVIHHGGIGTTAQGLAAGVPQLVMPLAFDQHDNAARLERLGVARTVSATRFTSTHAVTNLLLLLGDPGVPAACAAAKARMAEGDAVAEACRWVEELQGTDRPGGWR